MSSNPIVKRARADTSGEAIDRPVTIATSAPHLELDRETIQSLILALPFAQTRNILVSAAATHPDVLDAIRTTLFPGGNEDVSRAIDFDGYSKYVWKELNVNYRSMCESAQYEAALDVTQAINSTIDTIVSKCRWQTSSAETRQNGLSVLRKIGKSILLSGGDTLTSEVQKTYQTDTVLEDGMLSILGNMEPHEKSEIRQNDTHSEALWAKLVELEELSEEYGLFPNMKQVVNLLDLMYDSPLAQSPQDEDEDEEGWEGEEGNDDPDE